MPFRPEHSLLNLNLDKMHTIDTRSVENLYGLWAVFSKTSNALEDGKRLENLSWRLWNRETFCCCPETKARSTHNLSHYSFPPRPSLSTAPSDGPARTPQLASSVGSASTMDSDVYSCSQASTDVTRPELVRLNSTECRTRGREKHITPIDLEKIVVSITQQQTIEPLDDLPPLAHTLPSVDESVKTVSAQPTSSADEGNRSPPPSSLKTQSVATVMPEQQSLNRRRLQYTTPIIVEQVSGSSEKCHLPLPHSSASTVLTQDSRTSSQISQSPQSPDTSLSTHNTHNIIRGFVPGGACSSYRSQTQLAPEPVPIPYASGSAQARKQQKACFTLGTSADSDAGSTSGSSRQTAGPGSNPLNRRLGSSLKKASLPNDDLKTKVQASPVFESDAEEDDDDDDEDMVDDDDVTDDDDDIVDEEQDASDWEDEAVVSEDGHSSGKSEKVAATTLFQRVDSRPNLRSHRSLITTMMHEGDRARALATQAAHSQPDMQRPHVRSPPAGGTANAQRRQPPGQEASRPQGLAIGLAQAQTQASAIDVPINVALSPRTTRRNMLATELTESLRRNILWERQQKIRALGPTNSIKRRHTTLDVMKLAQQQQEADMPRMSHDQIDSNDFNANDYLHTTGLEEYHAKGW